jgi:hypothetical protein
MLEHGTSSTSKSNENVHSYHHHIGQETERNASRADRWNWPAENFRSTHSVEYRTEGEFEHQVLQPTA